MIDLLKNTKSLLPGIWKYRYWGAATTALIGAAGIAATVMLPGNYEATARAYVDTQTILKPLMEGMTVQPNFEQQVQMMARTLVSRPTLEKIVAAGHLDTNVKSEKDREALLQALAKDIKFRPAGGTNHYSIEYRNPSQDAALKVVSTLLAIFVDATRNDQARDTRQALAFIDDEINKAQQTLLATEAALKDFKIRHIDVMPNLAQDSVSRSSDAQKEVQLARLEYRQSVNSRNAIRERLASVPEFQMTTDGTRVVGGRETTEVERRLEATRKRLDDLLVRYTDEHPEVIHTKQSIQEMEAERRAELRNPPKVDPVNMIKTPNKLYQDLSVSLSDAEARVASNAARVADAEARVAQARQMALSIPKVEAEYIQLNRDYQSNKQNYEKLLSRRDAARLAGSMESAGAREFRVVDPPRVSPRTVSPNRPLLLLGTLVVSILAGVLVAFLKDAMSPTFFDPASLRRLSSAPLFGAVTRFRDATALKRERRSTVRFSMFSAAYCLLFAVLIVLFLIGGRDGPTPQEAQVSAYNPGSALPSQPAWSTVQTPEGAAPAAAARAVPAPVAGTPARAAN